MNGRVQLNGPLKLNDAYDAQDDYDDGDDDDDDYYYYYELTSRKFDASLADRSYGLWSAKR